MIRMLFAMFVAFAGFTAGALWMARGGGARDGIDTALPAELRDTARAKAAEAREALRSELRELRDAVRSDEGAGSGEERAEASAEDAEEPPDVAATGAGADPELPAAGEAARADTAVEAGDEETVAVHDLEAPEEFVRDPGPADAEGIRAEAAAEPFEPEPDQEEWASLIRRMLAAYPRTRAVE